MATGEPETDNSSATDWLFARGNDVLSGAIEYFKAAGNASLQERINASAVKQDQIYRSTELQHQNLGGSLPVGGGAPVSSGGMPPWVWVAGALGAGALIVLLVKN